MQELSAFLNLIRIQVDHCYLFSWSKIGCKLAESLQMFLCRWDLLIKSQLKLSNRDHQLHPGSSGCSWPGPARRESSLADSEASAPHPRAPPSYSCGADTAAGAPLKYGPHKHTWITSTERNTLLPHKQTHTTKEGLGWQWKHTKHGSLLF